MKKINSFKQLQAEKKRVKQQQVILESEIKNKWKAVKECLTPANITRDVLSKMIKNKNEENINDESVLKNVFTYGITLAAGRVAGKATEKLEKMFKK